MTSNQISASKQAEEARANKQAERETMRSNKAKESLEKSKQAETKRHNVRQEGIDTFTGIAQALTGAGKIISAANDPAWYNKDPQLVKDSGSISFNPAIGARTNFGMIFNADSLLVQTINAKKPRSTPGMAVLRYVPTIGHTGNGDADVINVASKNIYAYVRHANSGHSNYEAVDLTLYIFALDSLYSAISWAMRTYSLALTAKDKNRYYPFGALQSLGMTAAQAQDYIDNLANFRQFINYSVRRAGAFNIPGNFSYFVRHQWLNLNIFKDHEIHRSCDYMFTPRCLYQYNETYDSGAGRYIGRLDAFDFYPDRTSVMQAINDMLDALVSSEDIAIMSGDILKAYGEAGLFKFTEISADFHIEATFSTEVLAQISSATIVGPVTLTSCNIGQDTAGHIYQGDSATDTDIKVVWGTSAFSFIPDCSRPVLNFYKDDVTPDDVMVSSRLMAIRGDLLWDSVNSINFTKIVSCGSEVVSDIKLSYYDEVSGAWQLVTETWYDGQTITLPTGPASGADVYKSTFELSKFDWIPRIRICGYDSSVGVYPIFENFDLANYAILDVNILENLHTVALSSELDLPVYAVNAKVGGSNKRK